jgi:hypothetical protein
MTLLTDSGSTCIKFKECSGDVALAALGNGTERLINRVQMQGTRRTASEAGSCPPHWLPPLAGLAGGKVDTAADGPFSAACQQLLELPGVGHRLGLVVVVHEDQRA